MLVFISLAAVSGKSSPLSSDAALTNGCMSLVSLDGKNLVSISGIPDEKKRPSGNLISMKPIPLLAYPIMNSSMTNSLVLDPFGGSGSTLIACEQTGRICYTIELDEKFCDVIVKRYIEQVGSSEKVSVIRDGLTYSYDEITLEAEDATLL